MKTGDKRSVYVDSGSDKVPVDAQVSPRGELVVATTGSFELTSKTPVKIIVTVPKGELEGVSISPSGGALVVEGPIEAKTFNASSVMGAADLILNNISADEVFLASSGASRVFLLNKGFPDARVKLAHLAAGGSSSGFLLGVDSADLLLEGAADVAVDPHPGGNITGVALGANSVFAVARNTSLCNVPGPVFGQACVPVRGALASRLSPPVFTCGLAAVGPFSCPLPGEQAKGSSSSAERMGAQAPSPSMAEGAGSAAAAAPAPVEIATGGKRRRGLFQQQQPQQQQQAKGTAFSRAQQMQVPVLAWNGSLAFMRRCDAKLEDLLMSGAKVEESA